MPALKLPDPSRRTNVLIVFEEVPVVAEFATFPAVVMVANFESVIAADEAISAFTICDDVRFPDVSLCTTPAIVNPLIETTPEEFIFIRSEAPVLTDSDDALAEKPVVVLPLKLIEGLAVVPAGTRTFPVNVPPVNGKFPDAVPVKAPLNVVAPMVPPLVILLVAKFIAPPMVKPVNVPTDVTFGCAAVLNVPPRVVAVIVPALKFPDPSRATNAPGELELVPSVLIVTVLTLSVTTI